MPGFRERVSYNHKIKRPDAAALDEFLRRAPSTTDWSRVRGNRCLSVEQRELLRLHSQFD